MLDAFILDTNVLLSALLFRKSTPTRAYEKARETGLLIASISTLAEFSEVFLRPKFDRYVPLSERKLLLAELSEILIIFDIVERITACRDPKDDKFLELAVAAEASCIISGDEDLLVLNPFRGISILKAVEFLERF